jgi:hypothetical protein
VVLVCVDARRALGGVTAFAGTLEPTLQVLEPMSMPDHDMVMVVVAANVVGVAREE